MLILTIVLFSALSLGIVVVCVMAHWENEKRITYEEHLAPELKARGLKFVASRPPFFAAFVRTEPVIEVLRIELDHLQGKHWAARVVTFEDSNGNQMESLARLDFEKSGLTGIHWEPELPFQG